MHLGGLLLNQFNIKNLYHDVLLWMKVTEKRAALIYLSLAIFLLEMYLFLSKL